MRRFALLAAVLAAMAVLVAGCGSKSSSSNSSGSSAAQTTTPRTHFAKTKFVIHVGLAFGAFHRYIYKPAKAGDFNHPLLHKLKIFKAGLAALFVVHEIKVALKDAQSSPLLTKLVSPLTALHDKITVLVDKIRGGKVSADELNPANADISNITSQAKSAGYDITENVPSASQLASP